MKDDKRAIFTAASHAQKAADCLPGFATAERHRARRADAGGRMSVDRGRGHLRGGPPFLVRAGPFAVRKSTIHAILVLIVIHGHA